MQNNTETELRSIAFIIDGEVVDVINTDTRFAAILLSNPVTVDITGNSDEFGGQVGLGTRYDYNRKVLFKTVEVDIPTVIQSFVGQISDNLDNFYIENNNPLPIVENNLIIQSDQPRPCGCNQQNN
jgi:hypothetical protein